MKEMDDIYRALQKHLDRMPIGFPRTRSGAGVRLLRHFFSPEEAEVVLAMDFKPRTAGEIQARLGQNGCDLNEIERRLGAMARKGSIITRNLQKGERTYALLPLVLGMHEMQLPRLSIEYLRNLGRVFAEGFALEYISTAVPQTRIIPIEQSVTPEHGVATYDEVRRLVEKADPIVVGECICRKAEELQGKKCSVSHRTEVCMGFGEFAAAYREFMDWGREVSKDEALEIIRMNEEDGLVLQPSNQQEPYFICSCCGDCCGLLTTAKRLPRPADFFATNYLARIDGELCKGCETCVSRCQLDAVRLRNGKATVDERRCIGCGVCVAACNNHASSLIKKAEPSVPPKTEEEYYDVLAAAKRNRFGKLITGIKAKIGIPL